MRLEIAGAQITAGVVDVIENLQTELEILRSYRRTVTALSRKLILSTDDDDDAETMTHLRALQMMIRDLETIANPPGVDTEENDNPVVSL